MFFKSAAFRPLTICLVIIIFSRRTATVLATMLPSCWSLERWFGDPEGSCGGHSRWLRVKSSWRITKYYHIHRAPDSRAVCPESFGSIAYQKQDVFLLLLHGSLLDSPAGGRRYDQWSRQRTKCHLGWTTSHIIAKSRSNWNMSLRENASHKISANSFFHSQ